MKRSGIRRHVAWLTLVPSLVMVISLEALFLYVRYSDIDRDLLERGKLIARQLASSSEYGVFSNNQAFLQNLANGSLQQPDVRGLIILNAASEILVKGGEFSGHLKSEPNIADFETSDRPGLSRFNASDEKGVSLLSPVRGDQRSLWIYQPIIPAQIALDDFGGKIAARQAGAVVIEISKLGTGKLKPQMLWLTVFGTAIFLCIALLLVYRASRSITQPIRKLSDAMHAIGGGDLSTRISLQTGIDELDTLSHGLNNMAADLRQERAILERRIDDATQALRLKKEEAEHASHDKSRFLAMASHDLRQPLHALGLSVSELQRRLPLTGQRRVIDAEQLHLVGQVEQSVETLSTLLNALLDISKLDAGAVVPQLRPCDVNAIFARVVADYQMLVGIRNIRLIVRPCSGYITSDPQLLERILMNLVSNAIRYTQPGGCVMLACRRRGDLWRIEVRDSGVGITKIDQINIFREFFQLQQPHLNTNNGLGLGLSIVDRLVKLLGHRLELRSEPGKGSVFALEAPAVAHTVNSSVAIKDTQPSSDTAQEIENSPLHEKRLLVVDDDAMVLSGTSGLLTSWGCIVSAAASMTEVEQLLQDGVEWDFIISDYQLVGNENGIDVITAVRQHLGKQIPCILVSGDTSPAILKLASVNGHHLLHKPVKPAKLKSLVMHLLKE